MTSAPDRERERVIAPGVVRHPQSPPDRPPRERLDRVAWGKTVMILNVALIGGVAIAGLTHARSSDVPDAAAAGQPSGIASTLATPDGNATEPGTASPGTTGAGPRYHRGTPPAPRVKPAMRSNFAAGDPWPYGAGFREAGALSYPLGIVDGVMTHGAPQGPNAVSWLEKWMRTDVRTIGARVRFATNHSGAAVLTAWHTSVLDLSGQQQPRTGMRLVVMPGQWRLVAIDRRGASTLAQGSYAGRGHSATFTLVRRGRSAWVTDPDGDVTVVSNRRIVTLAGPWASWELRDSAPGKRPAGFEEIWAG